MKLEMGESLVYSWMRRVCKCQIVQLNWKPLPEWKRLNTEELDEFRIKAENYFVNVLKKINEKTKSEDTSTTYAPDDRGTEVAASEERIFKKTVNLSQLIAQTECDVIGINFSDDGYKIYVAEVAYHENGLKYRGGNKKTARKILSKFLRIIIALKACFPLVKVELIFASPCVKNACVKLVNMVIDELQVFLGGSEYENFSVSVVFNDRFFSELMRPVIKECKEDSDLSALCERSLKLAMLGGEEILDELSKNSKAPANNREAKKSSKSKKQKNSIDGHSIEESQKKEFIEWFVRQKGKEETVKKYVSGVNTCGRLAKKLLHKNKFDFFSMVDANEVEQNKNNLLGNPDFANYLSENNNFRKCSLDKYIQFLKSKEAE